MILLVLLFILPFLTVSTEIIVSIEKNYDTIVCYGDCSKLRASYATFGSEKLCVCNKKINMNGIKSELHGFYYQTMDGSLTFLFDQRETGK